MRLGGYVYCSLHGRVTLTPLHSRSIDHGLRTVSHRKRDINNRIGELYGSVVLTLPTELFFVGFDLIHKKFAGSSPAHGVSATGQAVLPQIKLAKDGAEDGDLSFRGCGNTATRLGGARGVDRL